MKREGGKICMGLDYIRPTHHNVQSLLTFSLSPNSELLLKMTSYCRMTSRPYKLGNFVIIFRCHQMTISCKKSAHLFLSHVYICSDAQERATIDEAGFAINHYNIM